MFSSALVSLLVCLLTGLCKNYLVCLFVSRIMQKLNQFHKNQWKDFPRKWRYWNVVVVVVVGEEVTHWLW